MDKRILQNLAEACGKGDADSMLALSEYLHYIVPPYDSAANMWLLRAAVYGNTTAQGRVREEMTKTPNFLRAGLIPYEHLIPDRRANWHSGGYSGGGLNAAGLLTFRPEGIYLLSGINQYRTMLVWQEAGDDPADEDGFGAESYYNMFYLDEFFQPIPGVPVVESVSTRDIEHLEIPKKRYEEMTNAMVEAMDKRDRIPLWTEFAKLGTGSR